MGAVSYITFPPGGYVYVPTSPRRAAAAGLTMYSPCRRLPVLAQHVAWGLARGGAARWLPGPRLSSPGAIDLALLASLIDTWAGAHPAIDPAGHHAVYYQPQKARSGFAVLLLGAKGVPVAFAKCRRDGRGLARERDALENLSRAGSRLMCPIPLACDTSPEWAWLLTTTMPNRPHRPAPLVDRSALFALGDAIRATLHTLPKPEDAPEHWQPMHGDLTPWNVRRSAGSTWLIDWEDCGYGPPRADEIYLAANAIAAGMSAPVLDDPSTGEAVNFWRSRISNHVADPYDRAQLDALDRALVTVHTRAVAS